MRRLFLALMDVYGRLGLVQRTCAGLALGIDFSGTEQALLGESRSEQFVDQNAEQNHVSYDGTVAEIGGGKGHSQSNTSLREESDTQILGDGFAALYHSAGKVGEAIFTGATGENIDHTDNQGR